MPSGAGFKLLRVLAEEHLEGSRKGLDPLDYPMLSAGRLRDALELGDDGTVRQVVNRTRNLMAKKVRVRRNGP